MRTEINEILKNCIHKLYRKGLTTSSGGNVSCKDKENNIWISPTQKDKGFLKAKDFAYINLNGDFLGKKKPSMEFPIHLSIYKKFNDTQAICHIHPPILVAFSLIKPNKKLFHILQKFDCGYAKYFIPGSKELEKSICQALKEGYKIVIMQNHGVLATAPTIFQAVRKIITLNSQIKNHFSIDHSLINYLPDNAFKNKPENSIGFYQSRIKHFLSVENDVEIFTSQPFNNFNAIFKLISIKKLQDSNINFENTVIPESYFLLKNIKVVNGSFSKDNIHYKNPNISIVIYNNGIVSIKSTSLYNLYDKAEVLDFTAREILLASKMGNIKWLSNNQIVELEKFFSTG